jgi:serine/threonine protein kinase
MPVPVTRLNAALEGRYAIERELGAGGMATVYLAKDLKHNRNVALKVLKPELAAVVGAERFLAEIETTANLQHPHILPLFDSGEADSFLFYVMPYVEGETLRGRIDREKQLSIEDAIDLAKAIGSALDYAHERGVIHRDIKPENGSRRPAGGRRFRHRSRGQRCRRDAAHRNGSFVGHAPLHESRAGNGRPRAGRPQRPLFAGLHGV